MRNLFIGIAVGIILIAFVGGAYYFGKNQNEIPPNPTPAPTQYISSAPTQILTEGMSPTSVPKNTRSYVSENIIAAVSSKNYAALEGYMSDTVSVILYASECCGQISKAKATGQMSYLNSSSGTWDFSENNSTRAKLIQNNPQNFSSDMIIGISSDKYAVGFKLNSQNEIEKIILVSNYSLIVP
ncbi:MAG: hypothetical protein A3B44_00310 [Candidatus Levybacteria bacterium RIFCSPLOWO2_01_FULL_38_21]|nr:MAG: hypothetical protein A3B44_00310 [Candidatus Levybacteria bacterium RIFCSPLOWO2_01_FULL_38_21]